MLSKELKINKGIKHKLSARNIKNYIYYGHIFNYILQPLIDNFYE